MYSTRQSPYQSSTKKCRVTVQFTQVSGWKRIWDLIIFLEKNAIRSKAKARVTSKWSRGILLTLIDRTDEFMIIATRIAVAWISDTNVFLTIPWDPLKWTEHQNTVSAAVSNQNELAHRIDFYWNYFANPMQFSATHPSIKSDICAIMECIRRNVKVTKYDYMIIKFSFRSTSHTTTCWQRVEYDLIKDQTSRSRRKGDLQRELMSPLHELMGL